jgi:hypothetical protein
MIEPVGRDRQCSGARPLSLSARGMTADGVRDSLRAVFSGTGAIAAITLAPVLDQVGFSLPSLVAPVSCVIAGHTIGRREFERLSRGTFEPLSV